VEGILSACSHFYGILSRAQKGAFCPGSFSWIRTALVVTPRYVASRRTRAQIRTCYNHARTTSTSQPTTVTVISTDSYSRIKLLLFNLNDTYISGMTSSFGIHAVFSAGTPPCSMGPAVPPLTRSSAKFCAVYCVWTAYVRLYLYVTSYSSVFVEAHSAVFSDFAATGCM